MNLLYLLTIGGVIIIIGVTIGAIVFIQWWRDRSLWKEQEKAVNDFVDKMDRNHR